MATEGTSPADPATSVEHELGAWLDEHWDPQITLREWWRRLAASGWGFPTWPTAWFGRGLDREGAAAVSRVLRARGAIGAPTGLGTLMGAPVVLHHGTDEQRRRFLPPLAEGTEGWCQLFSEPGAGSDLASLSTRAERDGDEWIVTGQKVWTSGARQSRRGMLIARTNPDAPKHRGITWFVIDMDQPGIEVRPLKQMNGKAHFNEVFLTEARVHDRDRVGDVDGGWAVATATLQFERSGLSSADGLVRPPAGEPAGFLDRTLADVLARAADLAVTDDGAPGRYASLLRLAGQRDVREDPHVRQQLVQVWGEERIADTSRRRTAAAAAAGRPPGPASSIGKLAWTEGLRRSSDLAMGTLGAWGMLAGPDTPGGGHAQTFHLSVPSASIAGGSDEIQRSIIGERALGLPANRPSTPTSRSVI